MMNFKKRVIFEDVQARRYLVTEAEQKLERLSDCIEWIKSNGVDVLNDKQKKHFLTDMTHYFTETFYKKNKRKIQLEISPSKMLDLLDVNINDLERLAQKYYDNPAVVQLKAGEFVTWVDPRRYTKFTENEEENMKLDVLKELETVLKKVEKYNKVYPIDLCRAVNGFANYNTANNSYYLVKS